MDSRICFILQEERIKKIGKNKINGTKGKTITTEKKKNKMGEGF